jgi:hypothetical protein
MNHHRFREQANELLEPPQVPVVTASGFMACPIALQPVGWSVGLYQLAFLQAQAALTAQTPRRDLFAVWN